MVLRRLALATVLCLWLITGLSAQVVGAQAPPTISLSRDCGSPGGALTVSGSGFPPNTPVVLRYDQVTVSQPSTDTAGSFVSTFSVPNVGAGVHTVIAMTTSASDQAPHTVPCAPAPTSTAPPAAIALSRSCGRPGENLVVTGSGFPPTSPIDIRYDGVVASQLSTDTKGSFATAFRIPNVRPGDHTVNATSARCLRECIAYRPLHATPYANLHGDTGGTDGHRARHRALHDLWRSRRSFDGLGLPLPSILGRQRQLRRAPDVAGLDGFSGALQRCLHDPERLRRRSHGESNDRGRFGKRTAHDRLSSPADCPHRTCCPAHGHSDGDTTGDSDTDAGHPTVPNRYS